jgi:predicted nucleic acid-binding protein
VYTLDTNAIIYYTNDEPAAVSVLEPIFEQAAPIFVSTITVMELFSYPALTDEEEACLNRVLSTLESSRSVSVSPVWQATCVGYIQASNPSIAALPPRRFI